MIDAPVAVALAAGMAATVNPCGFALLPAYLAAFVGEGHEPGLRAVPRALAVSGVLTAGFVAVFGLFGLFVTPLAVSVEQYLPWVTIVVGIALIGLGIYLATGRELLLRLPKLQAGGRGGSLPSMFLFGVSYAVASLSCTIGPFLAVTSTTFGSGDISGGVTVFVAYGLGMGTVVTALTVGAALARAGLAGRLRRVLPYVSRASGALLILAGAYVAWFGWFEVRVLSGGGTEDPIVDRAGQVQSWLQNALVPDDPVTVVGALLGAIVLTSLAVVLWRRRTDRVADRDDRSEPPGATPSRRAEATASAEPTEPLAPVHQGRP